jgi:hypothetical protein
MTMRLAVLAIMIALAGCDRGSANPGAAPATTEAACVRQPGMPAAPSAAFRDFLATRPTAQAFRARYGGITLVMPGDIATRELRLDCSRFFADTDNDGHVAGGRFG